ncbi:MAG: hypothetical protein ACOYN0_03750 [Phycisphaerales bacterium]
MPACPRCQSSNCASYQAIFRSGTGTSNSVGISTTSYTGGSAVGVSRTSGTVQSNLAASCSPPAPARPGLRAFLALLMAMVFGLQTLLVGSLAFETPARGDEGGLARGLVALLPAALAFFCVRYFVRRHRNASNYNRDTLPRLQAEWPRSWACLSCDHRFLL